MGESIQNQADMVLAVNSTKYGFDETVLQLVADMYGKCGPDL